LCVDRTPRPITSPKRFLFPPGLPVKPWKFTKTLTASFFNSAFIAPGTDLFLLSVFQGSLFVFQPHHCVSPPPSTRVGLLSIVYSKSFPYSTVSVRYPWTPCICRPRPRVFCVVCRRTSLLPQNSFPFFFPAPPHHNLPLFVGTGPPFPPFPVSGQNLITLAVVVVSRKPTLSLRHACAIFILPVLGFVFPLQNSGFFHAIAFSLFFLYPPTSRMKISLFQPKSILPPLCEVSPPVTPGIFSSPLTYPKSPIEALLFTPLPFPKACLPSLFFRH